MGRDARHGARARSPSHAAYESSHAGRESRARATRIACRCCVRQSNQPTALEVFLYVLLFPLQAQRARLSAIGAPECIAVALWVITAQHSRRRTTGCVDWCRRAARSLERGARCATRNREPLVQSGGVGAALEAATKGSSVERARASGMKTFAGTIRAPIAATPSLRIP